MRLSLFGQQYSVLERVREASSPFYDASGDTGDWTPLSRKMFDRSLPKVFLDEVANRAHLAWVRNADIRRIVEVLVTFTVGGGFTIKCNDKTGLVQAWVDQFWNDRANRMDWRIREMARGAYLSGELFPVPAVNAYTGRVRLGFMDIRSVTDIKVDEATGLEKAVVCNLQGSPVEYRIIYEDERGNAPVEMPLIYGEVTKNTGDSTRTIGKLVGQVFYWPLNRPVGAVRGSGDLTPAIDWAEGIEQLLWAAQDKVKLANQVYLTLTDDDATKEELRKMADPKEKDYYIKRPRVGTVLLQNKRVKWGFIHPELAASDLETSVKLFHRRIETSSGLPEHWFGQGGDVNRATALEMNSPTHKWLKERQQQFRDYISDLVQFVIDQGRIFTDRLKTVSDFSFEVSVEEIAVADETKQTASLQAVVTSVSTAVMSQLISAEVARSVLAEAFSRAGYNQVTVTDAPAADAKPAGNGAVPVSRSVLAAARRIWETP